MNANSTDDFMKKMAEEEKSYQDHWVWKKLGCTPKEFATAVSEQVKKSGVDEKIWQERLQGFRDQIETSVREKKGNYQKTNLRLLGGIRL